MNATSDTEFGDGRVHVYRAGLVYLSACAPADMPPGEIETAVNTQHPTGIASGWAMSDDKTFSGGEPNPAPCDKDPQGRRHHLLSC
jgi:hypothetical protein